MATKTAKKQTNRQNKKAKGGAGSRGAIIVLAAVLVLAAAYCVLCAVAGQGDTLRKGTSVNGVDIGGLTREEAVSFLTEQLDGVTEVDGTEYATLLADPEVEGVEPYTVDLSGALGYDAEAAVDQAYEYDRGGSFLARGIHFLATLNGGRTYSVIPCASDEAAVAAALKESGLLDLNTTVQTSYELKESTLDFTMGTSGVSVDEEALIRQIMENTARGDYSTITCPLVNGAPDEVDVQAIYDEIYAEPSAATLDVAEDKSYTIVPSVQGIRFDVAQAREMLAAAQEGQVVNVPLDRTDPAIDTATLESVLFRDVLGEYTTNVSGTADRKTNVNIAAEKMNDVILLPGEVFSYNETLGERTVEAGYKEAGAYLNGETVQALGGGICQGSSTLYCACLYANLEIVERRNHSFVSTYVPIGMDATVSWGGPDYQFRNDTDYPIKISAHYADSKLTVQILGTKVSDFSVKITSSTLAVIDPPVKEVQDPTLPVGTTVVDEKGHTGYKVQTYRYVYDSSGELISQSDEAYSTYRTTDKVVRVGTMEPEPVVEPETPVETPAETPPAEETAPPVEGAPAEG